MGACAISIVNMNKFLIVLLPYLVAVNAGIYSAKWPEGEVGATLILRSGHVGLQGVESGTHNPTYVPELRSDLGESLNEKDDTAQVGLRSDLPQYLNIGYDNRPPTTWQSWKYQPKRLRSVIIEEDAIPTGIVESPEAPASTARTPELSLKSEQLPEASIVETEKFPEVPVEKTEQLPEAFVPKTEQLPEEPIVESAQLPEVPNAESAQLPVASVAEADNKNQLRYGYLIPSYNYYRNPAAYPIRSPSFQSTTAVAQNAPGINFAASSANNFGQGAALSQAANYGGFQSAVSSANNNQGSAVAAAQNSAGQSSSVAQAFNNRGSFKYFSPRYQSSTAFATNQN